MARKPASKSSTKLLDRKTGATPRRKLAESYGRHLELMSKKQRASSLAARDIGPRLAPKDPARREACRRDFRLFCETYFPDLFYLRWSTDHLRVIAKIQTVVLEGGMLAIAMPRGTGKSTLCELAVLWAALYGHRLYGVVIGPDGPKAGQQLDTIKSHLRDNPVLGEDFDEVTGPIRALEGIVQRATGQLCNGKPTRIEWSADRIVLPTVEGSAASGAIVQCVGITAGLRGMKHQRPDGRSVRPDLTLIDDPQTDESAHSPAQCKQREEIIDGAIIGLAGPKRKIAAFATVTVVVAGDLADNLLSHKKHPEWQGERTAVLKSLPTNERLWLEYDQHRRAGHIAGRGLVDATAFYRANQAAMDAGAEASWPDRYEPDQISAIQYAMTIKLERPIAFWSEYQNDPGAGVEKRDDELTADGIAARVNQHARGVVPLPSTKLTMFVDVQGRALYYVVAAWEPDFTGSVVAYGTEPEQGEPYFTRRDLRRTLAAAAPGAGPEEATYAGLARLMERTVGREWKRDGPGGQVARIDRCLIDYGDQDELIFRFCRQSPYSSLLTPSHGVGITADKRPMATWRKDPGERHGLNWLVKRGANRQIPSVLFDANWWKSFLAKRLTVGLGAPGALSIFGDDPGAHRLFADQVTAEYPTPTAGLGRNVDVWKVKPNRDNEYLDCLVGCAVGASMEGVVLPAMAPPDAIKPQRVSFAEMQRRQRASA
jgi:hypothetical protein